MVPVSRDVLVTFVDQSHVLFFTQFTPLFFKPGLSYVGQVRYKYSLFLCQNYAVINDIIMFLLYINNDLIIFILFISGSTETSRGRTSIEFRGERGDSQGQALHSIIRRSKRRETHSEAQTKLHRRIFIQGSQGRHQTWTRSRNYFWKNQYSSIEIQCICYIYNIFLYSRLILMIRKLVKSWVLILKIFCHFQPKMDITYKSWWNKNHQKLLWVKYVVKIQFQE